MTREMGSNDSSSMTKIDDFGTFIASDGTAAIDWSSMGGACIVVVVKYSI